MRNKKYVIDAFHIVEKSNVDNDPNEIHFTISSMHVEWKDRKLHFMLRGEQNNQWGKLMEQIFEQCLFSL